MRLSNINEDTSFKSAPISAYPGSGTGGARSMPSKAYVDGDDIDSINDSEDDFIDFDKEFDYDDIKTDTDNIEVDIILKEPDDWINPKVSKHRGPGA